MLSGALQLLLGLGRFGWLLNLVSSPILTGFTQAAAILILLSQLPMLPGLSGSLASLVDHPKINPTGAAFGFASLAALVLGKRWLPNFPVVVVALTAVLSAGMGFAASGGPVVGSLPAGLPALYWPDALLWATLGPLVLPAMVITLVSFLEIASSAKVEHQRSGTRWNENQDLIGQGLAKIASAFSGERHQAAGGSGATARGYAGRGLIQSPAVAHLPHRCRGAGCAAAFACAGMIPGRFVRI